MFSGIFRCLDLCQPAWSTCIMTKNSLKSLDTSSRKIFIMSVLAQGSSRAVILPRLGDTAAYTYRYSRTICLGTLGRIPLGVQQRRGSLIRPNRPSS